MWSVEEEAMGASVRELTKFTYEDYLYLPDDGKRYQIIEGEIYTTPAPIPYHQKILLRLAQLVRNFVEERDLGEVFLAPCDVILSDEDIVQPDIFFISKERLDIITQKNIQGVPDLIIEIVSHYNPKIDKILKKKLYERYGVREYWIVDPEGREIEVFVLEKGKFHSVFESHLFKGLKVDPKEIF